MTEPQQPAAPLEVDDPEPAPPEPNPTFEAPPAPEPEAFDPSPAFEVPEAPDALQAPEEAHADEASSVCRTRCDRGGRRRVRAGRRRTQVGRGTGLRTRARGGRGTGRAPFGRSFRGRGPARRRRPLRVHRPRRELPRRPRGARRRRDPRRRDPARGRGRVHGRGLRTADRQTGGLPRDARGWSGQPGDRDPHRVAGLDTDVRDRRPGRAKLSRPGGIPGGRPDRVLRAACQVERRASFRRRACERAPGSRPAGPRRPAWPGPAVASRGPARRDRPG